MVRSTQYQPFLKNKQAFFYKNFHKNIDSIEQVWEYAQKKDYPFLTNNRLLIEQEFNHLFASLKKNKMGRDAFWLYCYYCCLLLQSYYQSYGKPDQVAKYTKLSDEIRYRCESGCFPKD